MKRQNEFFDRKNYKKLRAGGATLGGASRVSSAVSAYRSVQQFGPAVETMFAGEGLGSAITLGAGLGAVGAIAAGAGLGYIAGGLIESMFSQRNNLVEGIMPGTYQGKFGLSAKKAFKGLRDEYQKKGAVMIYENYGAVADPDLVYVGHSTWNQTCVVNAIGLALLRKVFRVGCNIDAQTSLEILPLIDTTNSGPGGFTLVVQTNDSNGTEIKYSFAITANQSLETMMTLASDVGPTLTTIITNNLDSVNAAVIEKVSLYAQGPVFNLVYKMDMGKEVLTLAMSSHIVIQNRTKAAGDGSNSTTQIDVQPLKGPVYEFGTGLPKLKDTLPTTFNEVGDNGVVLLRAGGFPGFSAEAYKEPPVKNVFKNVTKSGFVRLNPGALKSMTVGTDIKGYAQNVFFKLRKNHEGTIIKNVFGKSQLVCFEEELNSGSANNITVQYECQHIAGAQFTTTKNPNMQPGYRSAIFNNLPPV